mmetsp:Transcript_129457/g.402657  ORF Transcript_129457/g.402657 Transcript_129457/m.402657 type:complete len:208 (+) Transcript_129457:126-749(+)
MMPALTWHQAFLPSPCRKINALGRGLGRPDAREQTNACTLIALARTPATLNPRVETVRTAPSLRPVQRRSFARRPPRPVSLRTHGSRSPARSRAAEVLGPPVRFKAGMAGANRAKHRPPAGKGRTPSWIKPGCSATARGTEGEHRGTCRPPYRASAQDLNLPLLMRSPGQEPMAGQKRTSAMAQCSITASKRQSFGTIKLGGSLSSP